MTKNFNETKIEQKEKKEFCALSLYNMLSLNIIIEILQHLLKIYRIYTNLVNNFQDLSKRVSLINLSILKDFDEKYLIFFLIRD